MDALTIQQAAETTGWSPRMLRYIEQTGLVEAVRSASGYRMYRAEHLQRLRTLRELLNRFDIGLSEVGFAARVRHDDELRRALDAWFVATATRPAEVPADDWLQWEQRKHRRLLAANRPPENLMEPA
ncbi:MAG TPA: MerR family transcriptional regulator [Euzebyales bacterium]|nr:MerR family transcriptional regulator [Euzebyales bacterium]